VVLCLTRMLYLHALRYMHPIAVACAESFAAVLGVVWAGKGFKVKVEDLKTEWAVPCAVWVGLCAMLAVSVVLRRRQIVECEVTDLRKRQHVRQSLTSDNLTKNQRQFGSRFYQSCEENLLAEHRRAQEERKRRKERQATRERERAAAEEDRAAAEEG